MNAQAEDRRHYTCWVQERLQSSSSTLLKASCTSDVKGICRGHDDEYRNRRQKAFNMLDAETAVKPFQARSGKQNLLCM